MITRENFKDCHGEGSQHKVKRIKIIGSNLEFPTVHGNSKKEHKYLYL
jgi:hypothetical protein